MRCALSDAATSSFIQENLSINAYFLLLGGALIPRPHIGTAQVDAIGQERQSFRS
jgi:hypothetical protein